MSKGFGWQAGTAWWKISAKPSARRGKVACRYVGGPHDGKVTRYEGKRLGIGLKAGDRTSTGLYRHETRPLGEQQGYEHVYVWHGGGWPPVPQRQKPTKAQRREQRQRRRLAGRALRRARRLANQERGNG